MIGMVMPVLSCRNVLGMPREAAGHHRRWLPVAAAVLTASAVLAGPPAAQAATPTISLVSLAPSVIEAGLPYAATLVVDSTASIAVQAITVAVRDSSGDNLDFPGAISATINGTFVFTSAAKSFSAGSYTEFGSYELDNTWYPFASQTLTVAAAPSSSAANPPPVTIPGTWTSSLNDGPTYSNGAVADDVSGLLGWDGATGGLQSPHNSDEDDCYAPANVSLDPSGDFVDLSLTEPATSDCVPPSGWDAEPDYGAQVSSDNVFTQEYGAFEAEVYLPPTPEGTIADWPAWWLTGTGSWPNTGEIDLVEGLSGTAEYHFHYGASAADKMAVGGTTSIGPGWHTFGVDWQPARDTSFPEYVMTFYYDGKYAGMFDEPQASGELTAAPMMLVFDISNTAGNADQVIPARVQVTYARAWTGSYGAIPLSIDSDQLCLDDHGSSTTNLNEVDVYTCNGTGAQSWDVEPGGTVVSSLGGCLDVLHSGTASGTTVDFYQCNGTGAQQWAAGADGSLVNPESGLCLTDPDASTTSPTQLVISSCTGAADQDWI
jgi:Ricin-type beta-trefoil lectin domain/Glycosyl hydrolases family 16